MVASGGGERMRAVLELHQGGERRYKVNTRATVLPGTYDVVLPLYLTPWTHEGLVITAEEQQEYELEVPVGYATIRYQNADGSPMDDARVFMEAGDRRHLQERWHQAHRRADPADRWFLHCRRGGAISAISTR